MEKEQINKIERILRLIIPELLSCPDSFQITVTGGATSLNFIIDCDQSEISKIIGRGGRNIDALRQIVGSIGSKNNIRVNLIVNE
jgi:uncharacterized protein